MTFINTIIIDKCPWVGLHVCVNIDKKMNKLWGVKTLSRTKMFLIFVPN